MTQKEAIREACSIVGLAYYSIDNHRHASDGFCDRCPVGEWGEYRNDGIALDYVRRAVVEKLQRDGHKIARGFDNDGRELFTEEEKE